MAVARAAVGALMYFYEEVTGWFEDLMGLV